LLTEGDNSLSTHGNYMGSPYRELKGEKYSTYDIKLQSIHLHRANYNVDTAWRGGGRTRKWKEKKKIKGPEEEV